MRESVPKSSLKNPEEKIPNTLLIFCRNLLLNICQYKITQFFAKERQISEKNIPDAQSQINSHF